MQPNVPPRGTRTAFWLTGTPACKTAISVLGRAAALSRAASPTFSREKEIREKNLKTKASVREKELKSKKRKEQKAPACLCCAPEIQVERHRRKERIER
jgi:hypothetical protein